MIPSAVDHLDMMIEAIEGMRGPFTTEKIVEWMSHSRDNLIQEEALDPRRALFAEGAGIKRRLADPLTYATEKPGLEARLVDIKRLIIAGSPL